MLEVQGNSDPQPLGSAHIYLLWHRALPYLPEPIPLLGGAAAWRPNASQTTTDSHPTAAGVANALKTFPKSQVLKKKSVLLPTRHSGPSLAINHWPGLLTGMSNQDGSDE